MASLASTVTITKDVGGCSHISKILITNPGDSTTGGEITHLGPLGVAPDEVIITPTSAFTAGNTHAWAHTASNTTTGTVTLIATVEGAGTIIAASTTTVTLKWYAAANQDRTSLDNF